MRILAKMINAAANSQIGRKLTNPITAGTAAGTIATISCVTKDAVNCAYYVHQSLNNERIPEEKRKFVASLDLSNGILNIITQLILGPATEKLTNKAFDKFVAPKRYSEAAAEAIQSLDGLKGKVPLETIMDQLNKNKRYYKAGLGVLSALIGTQIIAKRVIVPFLATPMASYFKEKFEANEKKKKGQEVTDTTQISFTKTPPQIIIDRPWPKCFKQFQTDKYLK